MKKKTIKTWTFTFLLLLTLPLFGQSDKADERKHKKVKDILVSDSTELTFIRINNIYILGNDKTKKEIITRELSFKEDQSIASNELDEILERSRNNVYNTNLFSTVIIEKLELDSSTIDILVKLEERWYVWPSFILRPVDRNFIDWWSNRGKDLSRVRLGPKLDIYNVGGRRETLRFIGLFGFDRTFIFQYSIPYIEKSQKHGLTLGGSWITNKKMPYETRNHITYFISDTSEFVNQVNRRAYSGFMVYSYRPSFYNYHYITLQGYTMNISKDIAQLNPNYYGNGATQQSALSIAYTFVRDRRDNRNYPLSGYYATGQLQKLGLGIFKDINLVRFSTNLQYYRDMGKGWYLSTSLAGQLTTVKNVPYFNYSEFGEGTYYVRGFEQFVIQGPQNLLTRNSFKKRLFKTEANLGKAMPIKKFKKLPFAIYAKTFGDAGYVVNYPDYQQSSRLTNKPLYSLGLGLDIVMLYDVTFRLEYSYNSEKQFKFAPNFNAEFQF